VLAASGGKEYPSPLLARCCDGEGSVALTLGTASLWCPDRPAGACARCLKGYDANAIRTDLAKRNIESVIPARSNRRVKIEHDRALYKQRNRIERMFGHLKINHAIAARYGQLASSFSRHGPPRHYQILAQICPRRLVRAAQGPRSIRFHCHRAFGNSPVRLCKGAAKLEERRMVIFSAAAGSALHRPSPPSRPRR